MPKPMTFPTLYDSVLQLDISKLKELGYLKTNERYSGVLTWSRKGNKIGSINIMSENNNDKAFVELSYKYNDKEIKYMIQLTFVQSNLKKGKIWYFICPKTDKLCRKLYLIDGYFLHREAFRYSMYESQIQSKKYRLLEKTFGFYFKTEKLYEELYKKHFKKCYAGRPTKKYLKLMQQIRMAEKIDFREIERMMIM